MSNPYTMPPQPPAPTTPRWARKRYVLPAIGLAFFLGIGTGARGQDNGTDAKPTADKVQPTATITTTATATATATQTATPEPAPTVTKTVKVKVTVTAHAAAADSGSSGGSSGGSPGGGDSSSSGGSSAGNGATALCNDGTYSYAAHHQGACSHHGGVAIFYR
ncbi:DUF3761 domain-containing protein [Streptomyces sp. NPDC048045]|uniref:DUF3761 domain-containing protein n=1 Tax=Streptomyces sp. NPDC048045 TaxID=3154710 RepID=UPI0034425D77